MTTIKVPDMMCAHCVSHVEEKAVTIDGCQNCVKTAVSELEDLGFSPEVQA